MPTRVCKQGATSYQDAATQRLANTLKTLRAVVGGKALTIILSMITLYMLFRFYFPADNIHPKERSQQRGPTIAVEQQSRAEEIRTEVRDLLARIQSVWAESYPIDPMGELNPPASAESISKLERLVGPLPLDFRAYLELHDGHQAHNGNFYSFARLLSAEEIYTQSLDLHAIHSFMPETLITDEGLWFHPGCLTFSDLGGGGEVINASSGKIYEWDHDGGQVTFVASSFTEMLRRMIRHLESDRAKQYRSPFTKRSQTEIDELGR